MEIAQEKRFGTETINMQRIPILFRSDRMAVEVFVFSIINNSVISNMIVPSPIFVFFSIFFTVI